MRTSALALTSALLLPLALIPIACATAGVEQIQRGPARHEPFERVAIFASVDDPALRREIELQVRDAFANVGVAARPTFEALPSRPGELDDDAIMRELDEIEADAALVVRIVPDAADSPGTEPAPNLRAALAQRSAEAPEGLSRARLASDLYLVSSLEFVWSARSEAVDTELADEHAEAYAQAMVAALLDADLIVRTLAPGAIETRD